MVGGIFVDNMNSQNTQYSPTSPEYSPLSGNVPDSPASPQPTHAIITSEEDMEEWHIPTKRRRIWEKYDRKEDSEKFIVESILAARTRRGVKQYLIKWLNYNKDYNTWEPEHHLDCPDLLAEFKRRQTNKQLKKIGLLRLQAENILKTIIILQAEYDNGCTLPGQEKSRED